uniref:Ovule protein n=1 Tax=Ascaris lumbricoides TaxID=6252 RepID=A0A0M3HKP8_ASCLU
MMRRHQVRQWKYPHSLLVVRTSDRYLFIGLSCTVIIISVGKNLLNIVLETIHSKIARPRESGSSSLGLISCSKFGHSK